MGKSTFGKPLRIVGLTVACGLALLSMPGSASAAPASPTKNTAAVGAAAPKAAALPMWKKPKNKFNGCIDSSQQNNEKFLVYVPGTDNDLWVWKENRGGGSVDPWVLFTETEGANAIPEGIVCATITAHGNEVAITIVTQNDTEQQVWQTDCTVNPDNANDPFDPNERCADFEELTPLPEDTASGPAPEAGRASAPGNSDSATPPAVGAPAGPNTGDGASMSTGPGTATAAGGALLGLAITGGALVLRRRRPHSESTAA
ncbi:hypothetical protein ABZV93_22610 [Actinopolymorpha sp. NPDC004070]|uniref:hypothetical protein n=1 Tax=Actinopolymorpha sp. NPDC004070 TaxID=3154548 RepID=UPI0033A0576A